MPELALDEDLVALRQALDQAITTLRPILPALEAWRATREDALQERAAEPGWSPVPPDALSAPDEAPRPAVGLFDPLPGPAPAERRAVNGAGSARTACERCGAPVQQQARGARRKFCSSACRAKAKAERVARREADPGLEPLPDQITRPFTMFECPDDFRSDPELLRPPALAWEEADQLI